MSSAHDAHGSAAQAHHDHDHFDGEPAHELSPGEPRTPGWLPAVGLALFTVGAVWLFVGGDDAKAAPAAETKPAAAAPAPAPPPENGGRPPRLRRRPGAPGAPGQGAPAGAGSGAVRKLTPQQIEDLKKRIDEARARRGQAGQPGAPGAPGGH
jgi:hypothetical protein